MQTHMAYVMYICRYLPTCRRAAQRSAAAPLWAAVYRSAVPPARAVPGRMGSELAA